MASQTTGGTGSGSSTGLASGSSEILVPWTTFDTKRARIVVRVSGNDTYVLNVMVTKDNGATKAVCKAVASGVVAVASGTALYVNAAELDICPHSEVQIEILSNNGTLAYYFSRRVEVG